MAEAFHQKRGRKLERSLVVRVSRARVSRASMRMRRIAGASRAWHKSTRFPPREGLWERTESNASSAMMTPLLSPAKATQSTPHSSDAVPLTALSRLLPVPRSGQEPMKFLIPSTLQVAAHLCFRSLSITFLRSPLESPGNLPSGSNLPLRPSGEELEQRLLLNRAKV
jgi:hypothetical protein